MMTDLPEALPACPHCEEGSQRLLELVLDGNRPWRHDVFCGRCRRLYRITRIRPKKRGPVGFAPVAAIEPESWRSVKVNPHMREVRQ
ncbi:MAG: hypothetical protein ACYC4U_20850 [Pirellulaceae bacterium]